jgi:hypothetical protein
MTKKIFQSLILFFLATCPLIGFEGFDLKQLPAPYNHARLMPYNPHGWYINAAGIEKLAHQIKPKVIIEIGSWMGLSTTHFASLVGSEGKVYAVDTWCGSPNEGHDPQILASLYDQFLSNMIHKNLTNIVVPIRMDSLEAAKINDVYPDLIYLDATHRYEEALADLNAWFPFVKGHGVMCGDDWAWGDRGVERAVTEFAVKNHLKIHTNGWFWYLEE